MNAAWTDRIRDAAQHATPQGTLAVLEAIATARRRLPANVAPLLALEGMLMSVVLEGSRP